MNWLLFQNSLLVAVLTTVCAVALGSLAALCLMALESRWRKPGVAAAIVAFALPPFLVVNCWLHYLGQTGEWRGWLPMNIFSLGGTVWILTLLTWPVATLLVLGAWRQLEPAQLEADPIVAGWALVRALLWPLGRGAVVQSAALVFVLALNNFAVPAILQVKVFPAELWVDFNTTFDYAAAWKISWPMIVAPLLVLSFLAMRTINWPQLTVGVPAREFRRQLGPGFFTLASAVAVFLLVVSVALPMWQLASTPRTWTELPGAVGAGGNALFHSVLWATITATLTAGLCCVFHPGPRAPRKFWSAVAERSGDTAFGLSKPVEKRRGKSEQHMSRAASRPTSLPTAVPIALIANGPRWVTIMANRRKLVSVAAGMLLWLPFLVPGVLLGIVFIALFNRPGLAWFYQGSGIVLAAFALRYLGVTWAGVSRSLRSVDSELVDAARIEGANRWQLFRHVLAPLALPQLAAVWYLVFLLCLWDVETIVLIIPPGGETLALRIFNLLHYGHNAQVNALCLTLLAVALAPLAAWWIANSKFQARSARARDPIGVPSSKETPNANIQRPFSNDSLGAWNLALLWGLVLGIWNFCSGCAPQATTNSTPLDSKLFERAEIIGTRGTGLGQFNKPRSLAVDRADNLYVVDMTGRVQKFSPDGQYLAFWQMPQTDKGKPKGMTRDRDGNIVVVEPHYSRVNVFTTNTSLVAQWGIHGTNAGEFGMPRAVAVNSRGEFYVSEYTDSERVQRFAVSRPAAGATAVEAKLLTGWGKPGTAPGDFNRAEGIAVDSMDRVYVADSCNHRIQVFDADGKFLRTYGRPGSGRGELSYPYDICVDADGNQFVCEFGNSRIQVFDANDQPVEIIGGAGGRPGQFANPWAVALDSHGNLYVADAINHRVQKLIRRKANAQLSPADSGTTADIQGWSVGGLEYWGIAAFTPFLHHSITPLGTRHLRSSPNPRGSSL